MHQEATSCPDNWHCCPRGSHCSPDCNFRSCKCLSPSLHPVAVSKSNKEEQESKSQSESHSTSVKPVKEGKEQKIEPKTEKKQKEIHKTSKKTNRMKSRKKVNGKTKHKLNLKDVKHKKHKHSGSKKKERKKIKKLRSKAKDKGSKSKKLKKLKKTKAIQKMNKNVVKAHKTHQKTNFHPTPKQHWVTIFNERLSTVKKHKPNIKFSHTWGRQKHQKLSYKSNRNENSIFDKNASMTDELKHLIVNHRKEKLRRRLKLRLGGHIKHMHGNHRKGFTGRRKQTAGKKQKEGTIHSNNTRKMLQKHDSKFIVEEHREPNKYNVEEHKAPYKTENNPSRLAEKMPENENHVAVDMFSNLRQTLQEKSLSKENASSKLDLSKLKGNIVKHLANSIIENKTEVLGKNKSSSILKSEETTDLSNGLQITSSNEKMPLTINNNEPQDVDTNLEKVSDTSNNASTSTDNKFSNSSTFNSSSASRVTSIDKGEMGSSEEVGVLNAVHTTEGSLQSGEGESSTNSLTIIKPNSSEIDEITTGQDQPRLESNGNVQDGRSQNDKASPSILERNVSNANTDGAVLDTGMRSQARTYQAASGRGLEADESSTGTASGFEMQSTLSGDKEDSYIHEHIKVFLGGDDTSGSTKHLEESETSNEFPASGDWSSESPTSEGDGFYKASTWTSAYAGFSDATRESGSSFESFSAESGNDHHFGGEGDNDEDTDFEERNYYSSGRDDIHQPELFPSRETTSFNQVEKPEFVKTDGEQSFQLQNGDFDSSSSTDYQIRYSDWDDTKESYNGFGSGNYESSTDEWGSGADGSSLIRLSTQAKPISLRKNTTADNSNTTNLVYQNSGDFVEEHGKNNVVSGEDMNLEKRNRIFGSLTDDQKRSFDETELRVKSLRHKHTENSINAENNPDLTSWEDKELEQLLYWLSVATDVEKKQLKQITAHKDVWRLRPKPTSGYSRLQGMLLDKILPDLSRKERKKFNKGDEKDKETFRTDASQDLTTSGSGIETGK